MEEELLRKNLGLIQTVARRAGVEIIVAFKAFAMWKSFPIFRQYVDHSTASSVYEARLAAEEFGSKGPHLLTGLHGRGLPRTAALQQPHHVQLADTIRPLLSAGKGPRRHLVRHSHQSRVLGSRDRTLQPLRPGNPLRCHSRPAANHPPRGHRRVPLPQPLRVVLLRAGTHPATHRREVCPLVFRN